MTTAKKKSARRRFQERRHFPRQIYWSPDGYPEILCNCGFVAGRLLRRGGQRSTTWKTTGADLDRHLDNHEHK